MRSDACKPFSFDADDILARDSPFLIFLEVTPSSGCRPAYISGTTRLVARLGVTMNNNWIRAGFVLGVVFVLGAGAWALGVDVVGIDQDEVNIIKKDTISCKKAQNYCTLTCGERPYPGVGVCQDGKGGPTTPMTIECCCCTDGWEKRYFIGG